MYSFKKNIKSKTKKSYDDEKIRQFSLIATETDSTEMNEFHSKGNISGMNKKHKTQKILFERSEKSNIYLFWPNTKKNCDWLVNDNNNNSNAKI